MLQEKTINRLKSLGIPVNRNLPNVDLKSVRSGIAVAQRVNILGVLLAVSNDEKSIPFFKDLLEKQDMMEFLSPFEKELLLKNKLTKQEEIEISWSQESLYGLAWCLGLFSDMNIPIKEAELSPIFKLLPPEVDLPKFLSNAQLVNNEKLLEEAEFYYALHWAKRHPESWSLFNRHKFNKYRISIIRERRRALEWVIDMSIEWDEISLDT